MKLLLPLTLLLTLLGCGGGGETSVPTQGNTPSNQSPIGLWVGTTPQNADFSILVTSDTFYVITESAYQNGLPSSVITGKWTVNGTGFKSVDAVELSSEYDVIIPVSITANVSTEQTFSGTLDYGNLGSVSFNSSFNRNFDRDASLTEIVGLSRGVSFSTSGYDNVVAVIESNGSFYGSSYFGCSISGRLTANNLGNFYDASINSTCPNGQSDSTGIAYYNEDLNGIVILGINNTQTNGVLYWGGISRVASTSNVEETPAGSSEQLSKAEGFWQGSTSDNRNVTGLVTDSGEGYILYSGINNNLIAGVVSTHLNNTSSGVISSDAVDFNFAESTITSLNISATTTPSSSIEAILDYGSAGSSSASMVYDSNYNLTPLISNIAGDYTGTSAISAGVESVSLSISQTGQLTGVSSIGCTVTGFVKPKARGNFFDLSISFNGSPCLYEYQVFTGVLVRVANTGQIIAIAPNNTRTDGVLFISN